MWIKNVFSKLVVSVLKIKELDREYKVGKKRYTHTIKERKKENSYNADINESTEN